MAEKTISNPSQAFSVGASWSTPSIDNAMTTENADLINGSGLILYVGDIVCIDVTGTQAVLAGGAADNSVIGTVGDPRHQATISPPLTTGAISDSLIAYPANSGGFSPFTDSATRTETAGFTNGSPTVTDANAVASDMGKTILTPYNAATNANPQVFTITAVTPGTGYTVNANFTGTTGNFVVQILDSPQALGPGWRNAPGWTSTSTFPPGVVVPVTIRGYGRVNINGVAGTVKGDLIAASGASSVVGARTASGATAATQTGSFIAVTLEAYAARDTSLTTAGITGHDSVRAIIGKM